MKKIILFLMITGLPQLANAGAGAWSGFLPITDLVIENNNALVVFNNEAQTNYIPATCTEKFNVIDMTTEHGKAMFAMVLSARMNDKKIRFKSNVCSTSTRPLIQSIRR